MARAGEKSAIPTKEKIAKLKESWQVTKKRADKLVEKKIDPIYTEWAGRIQPWLKDCIYVPHVLDRVTNSNVDMARVALALPDPHRDPSWGREHLEATEEFAKDLGLDRETVDKYLHELMEKEILNPTRNGYQRQRSSQLLHLIHGHPKYHNDELTDLVFAYTRFGMQEYRDKVIDDLEKAGTSIPEMGMGMGMIRPRWKAIKDIPGVLPAEDFREVLKAKKTLAVLPCICKLDDMDLDCPVALDRCLQADKSAEYAITRGAAREVSVKEMLDIYEDFGEYPLINLGGGTDAASATPGCFCHWDCCLAMTAYFMKETKDSSASQEEWVAKSRFRATVDPERCIGCRDCVDKMCMFEAAQMKYYPEFGEERAYINEDRCMGCGNCVETCTIGARGMKIVEPPDYYEKFMKKRAEGREQGTAGVAVENLLKGLEVLQAEKEAKKE
ncbi:DUF362 domain-containing protein [Chloroflexota bacterium]